VQEIAEGLQELDDPPVPEDFWRWVAVSDWRRFGVWLARTLKPFGVKPKKVRINGETKQGYELADFAEAFARYLPAPNQPSPQDPNDAPNPPQPEAEISTTPCDVPFVPLNSSETERENANKIRHCSVVPFVPNYVKNAEISINLQQDSETGRDFEPSPVTEPTTVSDQPVPLCYMENGTNGTTEQPQQILDFSRSVSESPNGTTEQNSPKSLPIDPDSGLEVKVVCPTCGSWRRVLPDALMLADPRCNICGAVMQPEPEDSEERYIDTEDWVASFFEASNEPVVFDLETNEVIPVAFPNLQPQKVHCPRCGHSETANAVALLPPLCPACKTPMDWEAGG